MMSNDAAQKVTSHILPALPYAENALEPVISANLRTAKRPT